MKVILFANTDWYLYNFRLSFARALLDRGDEVILLCPSGPYVERLQLLGFRWQHVPMVRRSLNPVRELLLLAEIYLLFRREKPDIVHSFTIKCAIYGSLIARLAGGIGRVSAIAGMGYVFSSNELRAKILRRVVLFLFRYAFGGERSRVIFQNPDDMEIFCSKQLAENQMLRLIMGSGVDCERFHPAAHVPKGKAFRVLLPARVLWDKGIGEFVAAAKLLRLECNNIEFLLAGAPDPGNPASVPEAMVRSWDQSGVLTWLGHVDDMPDLLRSVDLVVLPSYAEGLPKGLIEAGASGVALITTNVPGCREVVSDGADGILIPVRDSVALANAIRRLRDDPVLRQRLGRAARVNARARFDEKLVITSTIAVYSEISG